MMKQVLHLTKFFLLANYDALWRLAHLLAEKGTLNQEEIKQFFDQQPIFSYDSDLKGRILARMSTWKPRTALARLLSALPPSPSSREAQIHAAVPKFPEPVDARELMQQNRREKLTHVKVHPEIPIASSNNHKSITASCEAVLLAGKEN
jgi:hypothetical protein